MRLVAVTLLVVSLLVAVAVVRGDEWLEQSGQRLRESTRELQAEVWTQLRKADLARRELEGILASTRWVQDSLGVRLSDGT